MTKKIQVSFSSKQVELLDYLRGEMGATDADIVRNIVIAWLAEKSFISTVAKKKICDETSISRQTNVDD